MSAVFGDTFYFLGLVNRADQAHAACAAFARQNRSELVTTDYILVEVADGLAPRSHRVAAANFVQSLQTRPQVRVIRATEALLARGLKLYGDRPDKDWSLTDCISFIVMAEEEITEAATGDHHFEQAGFNALLKEG